MRRLILRVTGFAVDLYYRRRRFGAAIPDEGPLVLVANHPNGLVDAVVVACATARSIRFLGKEPLFRTPLVGWFARGLKVLPVYRASDGADTKQNERTFAAVYEALGSGDAVCLFPEGKSHSEPALQDLKTGAARMALGAEAPHDFSLGVRIVPVGLLYRAKRRFGSEVTTWVGEPIEVDDLASAHREDSFAAARELTERIAAGLRDVTVELDQWEDLSLFELGQRIVGGGAKTVEGLQTFAERTRVLRERGDEQLDELVERVETFHSRLGRLGLSIEDLGVRYRPGRVLRYLMTNVLCLVIATPLAILGFLGWILPYRSIPLVTRLVGPTRDIHATVQILSGMVLFPLWLALVCIVVGTTCGAGAAWVTLLALPALGLLTSSYARWGMASLADIAAFLRAGPRAGLKRGLEREREALAAEILALGRASVAVDETAGSDPESSSASSLPGPGSKI